MAHAYAHILYKGLLFMGTGAILYSVGTAKLDQLGGLVTKLPWVMVWYMVAALSISGMPFFNGFISKTMTIAGAAEAPPHLPGSGHGDRRRGYVHIGGHQAAVLRVLGRERRNSRARSSLCP